MKMETTIKIFTLNCWGIIGISKHRKERMSAIASHLAASDYDFVFLQEVWSYVDFELIRSRSEVELPYSYYFHSGLIGSGLGILSKSPILNTCLHKYSLNGYAHRVQHGDWFGGKAVGLCTTFHKGLSICLYVTHLHAEYNNHSDTYLGHRVLQAFEFSQFVKLTSESCDLAIVAGDFNSEPEDVAYRLLKYNTACCDAFLSQAQSPNLEDGGTCCLSKNLYTSNRDRREWPHGQRIDYIFYKSKKGTNVQCSSCSKPITTIPGSDIIPYSDHEAVVAVLQVTKSSDAEGTPKESTLLSSCLTEAQCILGDAISYNNRDKYIFSIVAALLFCLLVVTLPFDVERPYTIITALLRILLTVGLVFTAWMAGIANQIEYKSLKEGTSSISLLEKQLDSTSGDRMLKSQV